MDRLEQNSYIFPPPNLDRQAAYHPTFLSFRLKLHKYPNRRRIQKYYPLGFGNSTNACLRSNHLLSSYYHVPAIVTPFTGSCYWSSLPCSQLLDFLDYGWVANLPTRTTLSRIGSILSGAQVSTAKSSLKTKGCRFESPDPLFIFYFPLIRQGTDPDYGPGATRDRKKDAGKTTHARFLEHLAGLIILPLLACMCIHKTFGVFQHRLKKLVITINIMNF